MGILSLLVTALAFNVLGVLGQSGSTTIGGFSGSHTALPRWCGKPYEPGSPNYNPGGRVDPPTPSPIPLLFLRTQPRYSIYDSSESQAEFIVDAEISYLHGKPLSHPHWQPWHSYRKQSNQLRITIHEEGSHRVLASDEISANTTKNLITVDLQSFRPRLEPYSIVLHASTDHGYGSQVSKDHGYEGQAYTARTELYYLPAKNSGSTVKIDNLNGGMFVANNVSNYAFEPLLPFGFYTSCSGYLNYSLANVSAYKDLGFNAVNPVCAFTDGDLTFLYDWMDQANLWYQYDMRGSYLNLTSVAEQIPLLKDRSNLLSWYTADEPDGWQYALNSTRLTYDLLKKEDPYHPTGLVLNCQNYFFEEYTSGTDYIMQDAYPVGINPTFSPRFHTACNETYGDCGCDNCIGSLTDVSDRLDDFVNYETWLGLEEKPLWSVLQAFSGEDYWARDPTPEETWVMMILSFNHKAKAMMSWTFPASTKLENAHGRMAKAVTQSSVSNFFLGGDPSLIKVDGQPQLDVAYWSVGSQILVAIANVKNATSETISIALPGRVRRVESHPWGSSSWQIHEHGQLTTDRLGALATDILILGY